MLGRAVAPDELSECESEDDESCDSETIDYEQCREDEAFFRAQWEAYYGTQAPQGDANTQGDSSGSPRKDADPGGKTTGATEGVKEEGVSGARRGHNKQRDLSSKAHKGVTVPQGASSGTHKGRRKAGEDAEKRRKPKKKREKGKSRSYAPKPNQHETQATGGGGGGGEANHHTTVGLSSPATGGHAGGGGGTPTHPGHNRTPRHPSKPQKTPQHPHLRNEPTLSQIRRLPEWEKFVQRTGRVVYLLERKHTRLAAGALKPFPNRNPTHCLFAPTDHRVPRMKIAYSQLPPEFRARFEEVTKGKIFLCRLSHWLEPKYALGELVRAVGMAGDLDVETEALLLENGIDDTPFPPEALADLPPLPWAIPDQELAVRTDLRDLCIFTIDPPTARDLDDALSCARLTSGNLKVGVHIADVSFFVAEGSRLDDLAAQRATSVYLVDRVVPMLPRALSEGLCSLVPGGDKLAVSVVWEVSPEGRVVSEWFGRTVIRSCAKLTYAHAQAIIDGPEGAPPPSLPPVSPPHTPGAVAGVVAALHGLASVLRARRFAEGALHLQQPKLAFSMDHAPGLPLGVLEGGDAGDGPEAHHLVEELMLLANMATAQRVYQALPRQAVLRRHPPPLATPLLGVVKALGGAGVYLDASSAGALQVSLEGLRGAAALGAASLCSRPMQHARYFTPGGGEEEGRPEHHRHYALSVPRYTHFTSPIRRYADVLVHRLLAHTLAPPRPAPALAPPALARVCEHCNDRKRAAKTVQEASGELCLGLVVREGGAASPQPAVALQVLDHSFDALLLRLGLVRRVYTNGLPLAALEYRKQGGRPSLTLHWAGEEGRPPCTQEVGVLTEVWVALRPMDGATLKFQTVLLPPPTPPGP